MTSASFRTLGGKGRKNKVDFFSLALWILWQCIRLPLFLLVAILEPVVSFVLGALALNGTPRPWVRQPRNGLVRINLPCDWSRRAYNSDYRSRAELVRTWGKPGGIAQRKVYFAEQRHRVDEMCAPPKAKAVPHDRYRHRAV